MVLSFLYEGRNMKKVNSVVRFMNIYNLILDNLSDDFDSYVINIYYDVNSKGERKARYVIKDNLLCFYYTFLYKNIRLRSIMDENVFFEKVIKKPFYEQYLPKK